MIDVRVLRIAGLSDDQIIAVVEADQAAEAEKTAAKREADRQRQIRCRERKKLNKNNDHVTVTSKNHNEIRGQPEKHNGINSHVTSVTVTNVTDEKLNEINGQIGGQPEKHNKINNHVTPVTVTSVTDEKLNEINGHVTVTTNPTTSLIEDKKESKKESRRGKICPSEFLPSETHYEKGSKLGLNRRQVESACEDMRNWSQANSNREVARKSDWGLALHVWMKRWAAEIGAGQSARDQNNQKFYGKIPGII